MKKGLKGLLGFLAVLMGISANNVEAAPAKNSPKPNIEAIVNAEPNEKRISDKFYLLQASPGKAGQSTEITVLDYLRDEKDPIEKIVLYEDGKNIIAEGKKYVSKQVNKDAAGKHVYNAEISFKSGDHIKTKDLEVSFKGEPIDFAPIERCFYVTEKAGKATEILVKGEDIGDNKGIERIVLYENGQQIFEEKKDTMIIAIERPAGKFKYRAEIIDKGGNVTPTKEKEVTFSGKAFAPDISSFFISPKEKAGKSITVLARATDEKNVDKMSGIEKMVIYENETIISESAKDSFLGGKSLYHQITKDTPGIFKYRVEAINKNGEKSRTEEITVNFEGKDLPPEVKEFRGAVEKDGYRATIIIRANDNANERDDAGIKEIILYENNKIIDSKAYAKRQRSLFDKSETFYKEITHHDSGKYVYKAEVINHSGEKSPTIQPLELKFF